MSNFQFNSARIRGNTGITQMTRINQNNQNNQDMHTQADNIKNSQKRISRSTLQEFNCPYDLTSSGARSWAICSYKSDSTPENSKPLSNGNMMIAGGYYNNSQCIGCTASAGGSASGEFRSYGLISPH